MPRPATGTIEQHRWRDDRTVTWRLRVRVDGRRHRVDLGTNHEGWSEQRAQVALDRILGQIERGTWQPPGQAVAHASDPDESVQATASRWWERKRREGLAAKTERDYRWRLDYVLADLGRERTADLNVRRVDQFRDRLVGKGLAPRSVNMVMILLAAVLEDAVEYELLDSNPARGRRRRVRDTRKARSFLEPDMVADLLDAAGEWEAERPEHQRYGRRALLALLCLAGPRISEALLADRGDFDLAGGRWRIPASKTPAGERDVELTLYLADELREHVAATAARGRPTGARQPMFPTRTGGRISATNVSRRLLREAMRRVDERRGEQGKQLLPARVTPHSLRRTYASLALSAGRDPRWVMAQLGHADATFTLGVYAQVMQRQRVDRDLIWRLMRFPDEPESGGFGPTNDPTRRSEASGRRGSLPPA